MKRLNKVRRGAKNLPYSYYDWPKEEQERHDYINNEISALIQGYELLRKRAKRIFNDKDSKTRLILAEHYGLDNDLINLALAMYQDDKEGVEITESLVEDYDLCKVLHVHQILSPMNVGEDFISLNPRRQLDYTAFPVAIGLNPRASKRDVLDFIEKKWTRISGDIQSHTNKGLLRVRKRKHGLEMIDFLYTHQSKPAKVLKQMLDEKFPNNGLVYFEITALINAEKKRRKADI